MDPLVLNLDPAFRPIPGSPVVFESFAFAGGEPHIRIAPVASGTPVAVTTRIRSFNDLGLLLLAVDALQQMRVRLTTLVLPYFPAARQDRVMVSGEPLSVKVVSRLINDLKFEQVVIFDPHSEVTAALVDGVRPVPNHRFIEQVVAQLPETIRLISPDGGALKKIYSLSKALGGLPVTEGSKSRDVVSGKLTGFQVYADDLAGQPCLVVDDICDGGGTFLGLAEVLKSKGAGDLYLAVSHGIFSRGTADLLRTFRNVFTTNSFSDLPAQERLVQIPLNESLLFLA
ncbi:MAG: ribose-phosphate diphosphokinase [Sphingobacteriales bacterium]|nr:MAG: ribose-phosphate diphosphokinase [Sphingobacteriales bacterium]